LWGVKEERDWLLTKTWASQYFDHNLVCHHNLTTVLPKFCLAKILAYPIFDYQLESISQNASMRIRYSTLCVPGLNRFFARIGLNRLGTKRNHKRDHFRQRTSLLMN
jgi:hypothetical protein